ncbi:MAG: type II toxin-antitoxin system RelB/DinJ family antitoxin [Saccharofermentanales bacterium]|jgi:addiction module RelB/DinJ family antitoxin
MSKVKININLNKEDKEKMEEICEKLGITMTGAINMFVKKMIIEEGIPFEVSTRSIQSTKYNSIPREELKNTIIEIAEEYKEAFEELAK